MSIDHEPKFIAELLASPRKLQGRVTKTGITLTGGDYDYFIAWNRMQTQIDLLEWIAHLCGKSWFTTEDAEDLIETVCKHHGWNLYGNHA